MAIDALTIRMLSKKAKMTGAVFTLSNLEVIAARAEWSPWDFHFNEAAPVTVAASATATQIVSYRLPPASLGILDFFAPGVQNLADWDSLTFRLRVNGAPIPGFDKIQGPIGSITLPAPVGWPIFSAQLVDVVADNASASAIGNVTAVIRGRFFPNAAEELLAQEDGS